MIPEVQGAVQLHAVKKENRQRVPQALLYACDRLSLAENVQMNIVFLSEFHFELLQGASDVTVRWKRCQPPEAVRERHGDSLMTLVRLPKGTFYMGWDGEQKGTKTEITEDFEIGAYPVTQRLWQAVMGVNPSFRSRYGNGRHVVMGRFEEELNLFPVEMVSWHDVQKFLTKLNDRERGRGWLYRLPTEAEWEYACRGGATSEEECSFHFYFEQPTNELSLDQANYFSNAPVDLGRKGVGMERPTRVGAYPPTKLGLCDMHGNVFEWCSNRDERLNIGVLREGSYCHDGSYCAAAHQHFSAAEPRFDHHTSDKLTHLTIAFATTRPAVQLRSRKDNEQKFTRLPE